MRDFFQWKTKAPLVGNNSTQCTTQTETDLGLVVGENWQVFLHRDLADNIADFIILKEKGPNFPKKQKNNMFMMPHPN